MHATPGSTSGSKRGRRLLAVLGVLVLLLVVLVALAPTIASAIAPGIIERQAARQFNGSVKVQGLSLSWGGPQKIGPLTVRDAAGKDVAVLNVNATLGLLSLAGGLGDLGTVTLSGSANLARAADGTTTVDTLLKPKAAPAGAGTPAPARAATLPPGLKVKVVVDKFDLTVADAQLAARTGGQVDSISLKDVRATANVQPTGKTDLDLKLVAATGGKGAAAGGSLTITGVVTNLADASGTLTTDKAAVEAKVTATDLPVAVVDALSGLGGKLADVIGPTLAAQIDVRGGLAGGDATINVAGQHLKINGVAKLADNTLTTPTPISIEASGKGLAALGPDLQRALADEKGVSPLTISEFPDVTIALSDVNVKLPKGSGALDLRGSSVSALVKTTRIGGTLAVADGQAPQALDVKPMEFKLAAPDLGGPVRLVGQTSAQVGGQPAGAVDVDLTATGLLNADGSPATGLPGGLSGKIALTGLRTALAQPFAAASGLDLPRDIGPTVDLNLNASTLGAPGGTGELPPTNIQFTLGSAKLSGAGSAVLSSSGVRALGDGIWFKLTGAGALASKLTPKDSGVLVTPTAAGGDLALKITGLSLPLTKDRKPLLDKIEARIDASVGGIAVRLTDPKTPGWASMPVEVSSVVIGSQLRAGGSPHVNLNAGLVYSGQPFTAAGAMDLVGIFSPDGMSVRAEKARPTGSIELKSVPSVIAGFFAKPPNTLDLGGLVREVVGNAVTVTLTTQPSKKLEGGLDMALSARGDRLNADLGAALSDTALAVSGAQIESTLAPSTAEFLVRKFAPDLAKGNQPPKLAGPARLVASLDPITIPMEKMSPQLERVGEAGLRVSLDGQTVVEGLSLPGGKDAKGAATPPTPLGSIGLDNLKLSATAPVGALMGGGSAPIKAQLSAGLLAGGARGSVERLAALSGSVNGTVAGGKPGKIDAGVKLEQIAVAAMDKFLAPVMGQEGMILAALGESGSVTLGTQLDGTGKNTAIEATLAASTQRLTMPRPTRLSVTEDRISLPDGAELAWSPDVKFLNGLLEGPGAGPARTAVQQGVKQAANQPGGTTGGGVTVQSMGPVSLKLARFTISKPVAGENGKPGSGPLKPGVFQLAMNASVPNAVVRLDDGKTFKVAGVAADATSDKDNSVGFAVTITGAELVDEKGVAQAPVPTSGVKGSIRNLADGSGNFNQNAAEITAAAQVPTFPTAIIDVLAKQNGLLVDALGPTVTLDARADKLTLDPVRGSGTLAASAKSAFAEASLQGTLDKGVFVSTAPLSVKVTQIQKSLSERLVKGVPITTSIEKTAAQLPALVKGDSIRVPLDNDLSKLAGNFSIEPGELRFKTGGGFAKFLNVLSQKQEGYFGQKLKPLNVNITSGVAKYQRWSLPLGEFSIETEGTVDLVNRRLEVYTFVPFGALSEEAAGLYKKSLGNVPILNELIQAATLMPFKTTGSFDNPKTEPDLEKFVAEFGKRLRPDDLLKKGLEDGLGDLLKGKKKGGGVK
jgi:hypothetical protein